ncbi:hypothetical protein AB1L10_15205 [Peribacillus frigoritolerans]
MLSLPCYEVKLATLVSFAVLLVNSTTFRDFRHFTREFDDFTREFNDFS